MGYAHRLTQLAGLALITACSSQGADAGRSNQRQEEDGGSGGAAKSSGGAGGATGGTGGASKGSGGATGSGGTKVGGEPCVPGSVWKPTSTRLSLRSFGFWEGSTRYEKAAVDLTAEQVSALTNLCVIPTPSMHGADFTSYHLDIEDADGSTASYRAASEDIIDGDEGNIMGKKTISSATLEKFLATFDCKSAMEAGGSPIMADGGDLPVPQSLPALSTDPGCFDGVFFSYAAAKQYLQVPVKAPGTLKIHALECYETTSLRLFPPEGTEVLASSGLVTAPSCPSIEVQVTEAGSYLLELEKQNANGADRGGAGDFFLRMSLTP